MNLAEGATVPNNAVKLGVIFSDDKPERLFNGEATGKNRASTFRLGDRGRLGWVSRNFMRPRGAYGEPAQRMRVFGRECSRSQ